MASTKLSDGQIKVVRAALDLYNETKRKESGLKRNADKGDAYNRVLELTEDTIELFAGELHSVYVNPRWTTEEKAS